MKTEKKSLLSNLKTAKKAIVASNSADAKLNTSPSIVGRRKARLSPHVQGHVLSHVASAKR